MSARRSSIWWPCLFSTEFGAVRRLLPPACSGSWTLTIARFDRESPVLPRLLRVHRACFAVQGPHGSRIRAFPPGSKRSSRHRHLRPRAGRKAGSSEGRNRRMQRLSPFRSGADSRRQRTQQREARRRSRGRSASFTIWPASGCRSRNGCSPVPARSDLHPLRARRGHRDTLPAASSRTNCFASRDPRAGDERQPADHERELRLDHAARRPRGWNRGDATRSSTWTRWACS